MNRRLGWVLLLCWIVVSALGAGGCAHPCGYVNINSRVIALEAEPAEEWLPVAQVLKLDRDVSATDATVEARVVRNEVLKGFANRKTYGRKVYVPYRWYTPILKPIASVTVVLPLYASSASPHTHGVGSHNAFDYWRDVVSWFNWFSALPTGPRRLKSEEMLIRSEIVYATVAERSVPLCVQSVAFYFDGAKVAEALSDENGRVRFDVGQHLTANTGEGDHYLALVCVDEAGKIVQHRWSVERAVWQALMSARDSAEP